VGLIARSVLKGAPVLFLLLAGCRHDPPVRRLLSFSNLKKIEINGYTGHAMEPFLSLNGDILLFNNLNAAPENTNLHWARRVDDFTFTYQGEISGVNTAYLEGVPTLDQTGTLYFVSLRDYDQTLGSIYKGTFAEGVVTDVTQVTGLSKNIPGWLNFDVDVDRTGSYLYLVDGRFDSNGGPHQADLFMARKSPSGFERLTPDYLANINTADLEYAACISHDQLEFYFTRIIGEISSSSVPQIYGATRESVNESFETPVKIEAASGFVEAPTLTPDDNTLYFHKSENGKFVIYSVRRTGS
jgi:hypothetical protein